MFLFSFCHHIWKQQQADKSSRKRYLSSDKSRPASPPTKRMAFSPDRGGNPHPPQASGRLQARPVDSRVCGNADPCIYLFSRPGEADASSIAAVSPDGAAPRPRTPACAPPGRQVCLLPARSPLPSQPVTNTLLFLFRAQKAAHVSSAQIVRERSSGTIGQAAAAGLGLGRGGGL